MIIWIYSDIVTMFRLKSSLTKFNSLMQEYYADHYTQQD